MYCTEFTTGYAEFEVGPSQKTQLFISITPYLAYGPSIRRDGFPKPMMFHPEDIINAQVPCRETSDEFVQRSGSWTIFNHLFNFCNIMGKEWRILCAQGFGDLSMNPSILAYAKKSQLYSKKSIFSRLDLPVEKKFKEPVYESGNRYTALLKLNTGDYEFDDISFASKDDQPDDPFIFRSHKGELTCIDDEVDLLIAGKPLVKKNKVIPLNLVINRFSDTRHIYAMPRFDYEVPVRLFRWDAVSGKDFRVFKQYILKKYGVSPIKKANIDITDHSIIVARREETQLSIILSEDSMTAQVVVAGKIMDSLDVVNGIVQKRLLRKLPLYFKDRPITWIYFGDNAFFDREKGLCRRRLALNHPLRIELDNSSIPGLPSPDQPDILDFEMGLTQQFILNNGVEVDYKPKEPGQFRLVRRLKHGNNSKQSRYIDIFYRKNVFPFSAIGLKRHCNSNETGSKKLVLIASGGKQSVMGDTVETLAYKMHLYSACSDAMLLDEGNDVFQLINPNGYFSNETILKLVAEKMIALVKAFPYLAKEPSNQKIFKEIKHYLALNFCNEKTFKGSKLFSVEPKRPQLRAILIVATKNN